MLDDVRRRLAAGDRSRAAEALADALGRFIHDHFAAGRPEHPFLSEPGVALLKDLAALAPRLLDDPGRAAAAASAVAEIRQDPDDAVFRINHALALLWPGYPLGFADALRDAKHTLGDKASNVEGALHNAFLPVSVELQVLVNAVDDVLKSSHGDKLDRIQGLEVGDFDVPEGRVPGLPPIAACDAERLGWACPACEGELAAEVGRAGQVETCACGAASRVPIPSMVRMEALLRARRDARMGVGRCRVCGAVIQRGRNLLMKAGFCTSVCARQGPARFRELVPVQPPTRDGAELSLACACGDVLTVPAEAVGTRVSCGGCGLGVWIPEPAAPARPKGGGPRTCGACGRVVKAAAKACFYCGASTA